MRGALKACMVLLGEWSCPGDLREFYRPLIAGAPKEEGRTMAAFNVFYIYTSEPLTIWHICLDFLLSFAATSTRAASMSAVFPALSA
jgi:hypothetical protein